MAKQIRAGEWFNHTVYYDFSAMQFKWSPEHEQAWRKIQGLILCIFLSLLFVTLSISHLFWKFYICVAIINANESIKIASPCFQITAYSFTNCTEHRGLSGPYSLNLCPQLRLSCHWLWGAGWGLQEGLGVVIKLSLFPPDSLQGSNFCTNWPASREAARALCLPSNPWR